MSYLTDNKGNYVLGGISYEKLGGKNIPLFPHLLGVHALFRLPVKAVHAVTMLSPKAIGL